MSIGQAGSRSRRVIVGSRNPAKIEAVRRGLDRWVPDPHRVIVGVAVPSGVSDQPMSDAETLRGARHRAARAQAARPNAEVWLGLEGGLASWPDHEDAPGPASLMAFGWIVAIDENGRSGESRTATFEVPASAAALVTEGLELGHAIDRVTGERGLKTRGGAVGWVSDGRLDRAELYAPAVLLAVA
ncbi:MAG: inosine/xanthosine triphosphatase, partial [Acidobacteriota bacterium]